MALGPLKVLAIAADGLSVQRQRMDVAAENIANAETTRTPTGGPYRRQSVTIEAAQARAAFNSELEAARLSLKRTRNGHRIPAPAGAPGGPPAVPAVRAQTVAGSADEVKMIYDPSHPDANADGYVAMPDVEIVTEMVELMDASRAYEANITAAEAVKSMVDRALNI
ncbi:MAG: flagellar basal body rod protein FlgC [Candidatus Zixiibacteriota bacterium]